MLVGQSNVSIAELEKNARDLDAFKKYCDSLVPEDFRHVSSIVNNQRYICAMMLRNSSHVTWKQKKDIVDEIMRGIRIVGYTDQVIDLSVLLNRVDVKRLEMYFQKENGYE